MNTQVTDCRVEPGQAWEVDLFRPEDAYGVARLFRAVYGEAYPNKTFIDPDRLVMENATKQTICSVARTAQGDIVGHTALFRSAPFDLIYESGAGLVLPEYRGEAAMHRLMEHSAIEVPKAIEVEAIFGEPVCNHVATQKIGDRFGWLACALEVDLMPAEVYAREESASGRVAGLLCFKVFRPKEQDLYIPSRYEELLRFVYDAFDYGFKLKSSSEKPPEEGKTRIETRVYEFAQVARRAVREVGPDFASVIEGEEEALKERGVLVYQIWLKLSMPWVEQVVEQLRSRGYFIGGALPRWFDVDGLLMQKVLGLPNWDGIQLYADRAQRILEMVKADWLDIHGTDA